MAAVALGLVLAIAAAGHAQPSVSPQGDAADFFRKAVGEWIGTCEQSTDGKQAENKYFHAVIKQVDACSFSGQFDYYRFDTKTGSPLRIGQSTFAVTIEPDGTARSKITGQGVVMVDKDPKQQKHELLEVLTCTGGGLQGKGNGTISVSGMPLGLGKNGKVKNAASVWSINNDVLTMSQSLKVGFRALIFTKSFKFDARYTARRGTDVASLMPKVYAMPTGGASRR
jgi:hypothetical protein